MSKELKQRLLYFAKTLSEHEEYKDSYTMGHFEYEMARNKQNTMREIGVGDMSLGKHVKKYVKKFYYRIKILDPILTNFNENTLLKYLDSLELIEKNNIESLSFSLVSTYKEIEKSKQLIENL